MIVTPICSHTLYGFTYVAGPDSVIRVDLDDFETAPLICPDGRDFWNLRSMIQSLSADITKVLRTATLKNDNFFSDVRKKIVQRGSFYENC